MPKSSFIKTEMDIWNAIYGPNCGPTPARMRILVEEFARRGLVPCMMRVGDRMETYTAEAFLKAMNHGIAFKEDTHVQVYYLPSHCEQIVGSSASTWVHWARLILEATGLTQKDAGDTDPHVRENLLRIHMPSSSTSMSRLLSLRMVVFYIAAQYEAWATQDEVQKVSPFKEIIQRRDFPVRTVCARKDLGTDGLNDLTITATLPLPAKRDSIDSVRVVGSVKSHLKKVKASEMEALPFDDHGPNSRKVPFNGLASLLQMLAPFPSAPKTALQATGEVTASEVKLPSVDISEEDLEHQLKEAEAQVEALRAAQKNLRLRARQEKLKSQILGSTVSSVYFDDTGELSHMCISLRTGDTLFVSPAQKGVSLSEGG